MVLAPPSSALKEIRLPDGSVAANTASILKELVTLNWLISLSLSAINFTATLCTLPALSPPFIPIFRHKTGESSKPTSLSKTRRAC